MNSHDNFEIAPAAFVEPAGFADSYAEEARQATQTIFVSRPNAEANGRCSYLLDDNSQRMYLPNTVRCFLNSCELTTVTYHDSLYQAQDKLLVHFTSIGGDAFTWRTGALSFAASSLVLGLIHMNSTALTGQVEVTWVSKGAAVFARVASAVNDGFIPVQLPPAALGKKLTLDELLDGMTFINKSISEGDAVPPNFFGDPQVDEVPPEVEAGLDDLINDLRSPKRKRRKSSTQDAEAVAS